MLRRFGAVANFEGRVVSLINRGYKVREFTNGKSKKGDEYKAYTLAVPNEIAESIPRGMTFIPSMTDKGILYQPFALISGAPQELPGWATEQKPSKKNGKHEPKPTEQEAAA